MTASTELSGRRFGGKLKGRSPLKGASLLDEFEKDRIKSQTDIVSVDYLLRNHSGEERLFFHGAVPLP